VLESVARTVEEEVPSMSKDDLTKFVGQVDRAIAFSDRNTIRANREMVAPLDEFLASKLPNLEGDENNLLMQTAIFISLLRSRQITDLKCEPAFSELCRTRFSDENDELLNNLVFFDAANVFFTANHIDIKRPLVQKLVQTIENPVGMTPLNQVLKILQKLKDNMSLTRQYAPLMLPSIAENILSRPEFMASVSIPEKARILFYYAFCSNRTRVTP
jgi:hypothetical protein